MRAVGELRSPGYGGGVAGELRQLAREMVEIVHRVGGARAHALREVVGLRLDLGCGRARLALGQCREKIVELRRTGRAQRSGRGRAPSRWGAVAVGRGRGGVGLGRGWGAAVGAAASAAGARTCLARRVKGQGARARGAGKWAGVATDNWP